MPNSKRPVDAQWDLELPACRELAASAKRAGPRRARASFQNHQRATDVSERCCGGSALRHAQ
eukprot:11727314-Alexandrium_andersonii.AAC.1